MILRLFRIRRRFRSFYVGYWGPGPDSWMQLRDRISRKGLLLFLLVLLAVVLVLVWKMEKKPMVPISSVSVPRSYGLQAMEGMDDLPYLKLDTMAGQQSSYDRAGSNSDGWGSSNFLYTDTKAPERFTGCGLPERSIIIRLL
jgi:hypothetical protein